MLNYHETMSAMHFSHHVSIFPAISYERSLNLYDVPARGSTKPNYQVTQRKMSVVCVTQS